MHGVEEARALLIEERRKHLDLGDGWLGDIQEVEGWQGVLGDYVLEQM